MLISLLRSFQRLLPGAVLLPMVFSARAQTALPSGRTRLPSDTTAERRALISRSDAVVAGTIVATTAASMLLDTRVAHWVESGDRPLLTTADRIQGRLTLMHTPGVFVASGALYLGGLVTHHGDLADLGLHTTTAVLLVGGAKWAIKGLAGRGMPSNSANDDPTNFHPGKGFNEVTYQSMPSGHTALAFAIASVAGAESKRIWPKAARYVAPAMYTGAGVVGISWLGGNRHWLSDVVLGAGVGTFTGLKVVHFAHAHPDNLIDRVLLGMRVVPMPDGGVLALTFPLP